MGCSNPHPHCQVSYNLILKNFFILKKYSMAVVALCKFAIAKTHVCFLIIENLIRRKMRVQPFSKDFQIHTKTEAGVWINILVSLVYPETVFARRKCDRLQALRQIQVLIRAQIYVQIKKKFKKVCTGNEKKDTVKLDNKNSCSEGIISSLQSYHHSWMYEL